jgi:hypothetical protein
MEIAERDPALNVTLNTYSILEIGNSKNTVVPTHCFQHDPKKSFVTYAPSSRSNDPILITSPQNLARFLPQLYISFLNVSRLVTP